MEKESPAQIVYGVATLQETSPSTGHFAVVFSVSWPMNGSEAAGDLTVCVRRRRTHTNRVVFALDEEERILIVSNALY